MSLVRQFGASPPPPEQVARVTERVVRDGRLLAAAGQLVPVSQAEELDLPHEVVDAAPEDAKARAAALGTRLHQAARGQVRTAAVAAPDPEDRVEAPEEVEYVCSDCEDWSTTSKGALTRHRNDEHGGGDEA